MQANITFVTKVLPVRHFLFSKKYIQIYELEQKLKIPTLIKLITYYLWLVLEMDLSLQLVSQKKRVNNCVRLWRKIGH